MVAFAAGVTLGSTSNGTSYTTGAFTPTAGNYLIAFVTAMDTAVQGTLTDSQGLSWTLIDSQVSNSTNMQLAYISDTGAAATSTTVTWDCTGDAATGAIISVIQASGTDGLVRQSALSSGGASTTPTLVFSNACLTSSGVIMRASNTTNPHGMTAPTGYTARGGNSQNTPTNGGVGWELNSGETSATITSGGTSASAWSMVGIELFTTGVGITHPSSGALTGQGSSVAGSSSRFRAHGTSGALPGLSASITGSSQHKARHTTDGALSGQGVQVAGTSTRYRQHAATGILPGQTAEVSGSSQHKALHAASGTLSGGDASIAGSSARFRSHAASGAIQGLTASVSGTASMESGSVTHANSGDLVGAGSDIDGSSNRYRQHVTSGDLSSPGASINGVSLHHLLHATTGDLIGSGADISGSSSRYRQHTATGALSGQESTVSGSAAITRRHEVTGELIGQGSLIFGAASNQATMAPQVTITATYEVPVITATYAQPTITATYTEHTIEATI